MTTSVSVTPCCCAEATPPTKATTKARTKSLFMSLLSPPWRVQQGCAFRRDYHRVRRPERPVSRVRDAHRGRAPRPAAGGDGRLGPTPGRGSHALDVGPAEQPVRPPQQHEDHHEEREAGLELQRDVDADDELEHAQHVPA